MSADHNYWVYMVSNRTRSNLYIGVTDNLERRISQHHAGEISGFTQQYHCIHLVYYEHFSDVQDAIAREKQLKGWRREKKNVLISKMNPNWDELAVDLYGSDGE